MEKRRVVVTGLGALTPVGNDVESSWQAILAGQSGVRPITQFDASDYASRISGSVQNFSTDGYLPPKDAKRADIFMQYGLVAGVQAIRDSGFEVIEESAHRAGVAIGSGIGGLPLIEATYDTLLKRGPAKISPFFIPNSIINMISGTLSVMYGLKGPNTATVTACTTGAHNIGLAARMIAFGDADVMVAGGAEMATCPLGVGGFAAMRALSTRNDEPEKASRPWDKDRDGFVLGDGAGVVVLEDYEHAKARGAKIYAELVGVGMSADAFHYTRPSGDGARVAVENALRDGGINAEEVHYINAHGTSTPAGDEVEVKAIKDCLGAAVRDVAVSSTKSMTGHLLGAAGSVEAIFAILAIRDNVAPPTINLDNPSENCDINLVPHEPQKRTIDVALSNSFGFGGTNGCLAFKRMR